MSWIIFKSVVSALVAVVLVGGAYLVYLKKYEPLGFAILKLRYNWWRLTAVDRFLVWLARKLEKVLGLEDGR